MPDRISSVPANPGPSLARVSASPASWSIDTRSPHTARAYSFNCEGCASEFVRALRDEGGWSLRFGPGCDGVSVAVTELDEAAAA